jgi:hypothetical protein
MAKKSSVPPGGRGLVNKVGYSHNHASDLGLWDKDSEPCPFPLFTVFFSPCRNWIQSVPFHKTAILFRNSMTI